jgi:membrane-associated phospholipid phosphatase
MVEPGIGRVGRSAQARPFLVLGISSALAAVVLGTATVPLRIGGDLDEAGFGRVSRRDETTLYDATHRFLDGLAIPLAVIAVAAVAIAVLRPRRLRVAALAVVLGSNFTTQAVKVLTERRIVGDPWDQETAFPSGHATLVLSLVVAMILLVSPAWRWTVVVVGGVFTAVVSGALLAVNWHRPSEILGGFLVVGAWTGGTIGALLARDGIDFVPDSDSRGRGVFAAAVGGALTLAILGVALPAGDIFEKITVRETFGAATAICGVVGLGLLSLTTALLQWTGRAHPPPAPPRPPPVRLRG